MLFSRRMGAIGVASLGQRLSVGREEAREVVMGREWEEWPGRERIAPAFSIFLPNFILTISAGFPAPPHPSELSQVYLSPLFTMQSSMTS